MSPTSTRRRGAVLAVAVLAAAVVVAAGCGDDARVGGARDAAAPATTAPAAPATTAPAAATPPAPALGHIHGMGIEPGGAAVLVAGHHGLVRVPTDGGPASGTGGPGHDLMGFAVASPGRLVASGHPAAGEPLPSHLGLVESRDGGITWTPVSLGGEVDFHVLAAAGGRLAGHDVLGGRLLVSDDAGATWSARTLPGPLVAIAIDPADADAIVASTFEGIVHSEDAGRTWSDPVGEPALLAAAAPAVFVAVRADGTVAVSRDGGASWTRAGAVPEPPAAVAAGEGRVAVATAGGGVHVSADGGTTFRELARVGL